MTRVAIIMSIFYKDDTDHFELAMKSLFQQSVSIDIFLYIDGKLDSDKNNLITIYEKMDNVIILRSDINHGLAYGLNALINHISHEQLEYKYIARMDSDDISYPNRIEKQIFYLEKNPSISILGTFCREFGSSFALEKKTLPLNHDDIINFSITRSPLIHPTVMFRYDIFKNGFRYPVNTIFTEDMALWFLLLKAGYKFANLDDILLDYRLNEDTVSRRQGIKKSISEVKLRIKYMFLLKKVSFKNILFIFSRVLFHSLPTFALKYLYANFR